MKKASKKPTNATGMGGMGNFMGAMNAISSLQDAYNDPSEQLYQPPKKVTKPIKKQPTQPQKATTITNKTTTKSTTTTIKTQQKPKPSTQIAQKAPISFNQARNSTNNIQKSYNNHQQQNQSQPNSNNSLNSNTSINKQDNNSINLLDNISINLQKITNKENNQQQFDLKEILNYEVLKKCQFQSNTNLDNHIKLLSKSVFNDDQDLPIFDFSENSQQQLQQDNIDSILAKNQTFVDKQFSGQQGWKRIGGISQNAELFGNICTESVVQGSLGDCYLISTLGVLSENPFNITRLFKNKKKNDVGAYEILVCQSGAWKKILLDDSFPVNGNGNAMYCSPKYGSFYGMLLEKAYAKIYGGYKNIEVGYSADAQRDFTGAVSEYIDIKKDGQQSWKTLTESLQNNFILTVSSGSSDEMINNHCYGILDLKSIKSGSKAYNFIKIRNPYGQINGQDLIEKLPSNVIDQLGEPIRQVGGILWMYYEDFRKNFEVVTVSKIHPGYSYSFMKFEKENGPQNRVLIAQTHKKTNAYFSIHQDHSRLQGQNFKYSTKRLIVAKIDGDSTKITQVLGGDFNCKQTCHFNCQLEEPGQYLVYAENDLQEGKSPSVPYTISCYSDSPVSLQNASNLYNLQQISNNSLVQKLMLQYIFQNNNMQDSHVKEYQNPSEQDNSLQVLRKYGPAFGYVYIAYQNQYQNSTFFETVEEFVQFENLIPYKPQKIQQGGNQKQNIQVKLAPNAYEILLFKIGNKNNCSHKLSFKSKSNFQTCQPVQAQNKDQFIQNIMDKGAQKKRNNGRQDLDVTVYTLKTNEGFQILIKNGYQKLYKEVLTFKTLENLIIVPENKADLSGKSVNIQITPKKTYLVSLNLKNPANAASKFTCSYMII